jgi:hypothetical protein
MPLRELIKFSLADLQGLVCFRARIAKSDTFLIEQHKVTLERFELDEEGIPMARGL